MSKQFASDSVEHGILTALSIKPLKKDALFSMVSRWFKEDAFYEALNDLIAKDYIYVHQSEFLVTPKGERALKPPAKRPRVLVTSREFVPLSQPTIQPARSGALAFKEIRSLA
jgi:hypothetical protein